jgi:hypothetical protein
MSLQDQLDLAGVETDQFADTWDVGCLLVWSLYDRDRLFAQGAEVNHTAERRTASKGVSATYAVCIHIHTYIVGRDSSVGIETRYGLNVPGIESR